MSLIKCPECGKEISDKSVVCVYCGYPIESETDKSLNNAPLTKTHDEKSKNKIKYIIIGVIVVIVLVVIIALCVLKGGVSKDADGLYNGIAWGTSYDDLKEYFADDETKTFNDYNESIIVRESDYNGYEGVKATFVYDCDDDGTLHNIEIIFYIEDGDYTAEELCLTYTEIFDKAYGDGKQENSYSIAIFSEQWETPESSIKIVGWSDDMVSITYEDIETVE